MPLLVLIEPRTAFRLTRLRLVARKVLRLIDYLDYLVTVLSIHVEGIFPIPVGRFPKYRVLSSSGLEKLLGGLTPKT